MILPLLGLAMSLTAFAQNQPPGQVQMKVPLPNQPQARPGTAEPPGKAGRSGAINSTGVGSMPAGNPVPSGQDPFKTGERAPTAPVTQVFSSESSAYDSLLTEEIIRGLRDPFMPPAILTKKEAPKADLELFRLSEIRLNGVITGPNRVRAMVTAPGNKTYFVAVGDKVGNRYGRVTAIQQDLIKIVEYDEDSKGRRIPELFELRLNGELVSLSSKEE